MKKIEFKTDEIISIKDFLLKYIKHITISSLERALKKGDIKVNNKKTTYDYLLKKGDVIKLFISFKEKEVDLSFLQSQNTINIFYEDENIIIINKECGILCQQDKCEKVETLNNQIRKYLYLKKEWFPSNVEGFSPNLCHRLDKGTRGLIVAAKNLKTLREMNFYFSIPSGITKKYIAYVWGKVSKGTKIIESYIMKNETTQLMEIDKKNLYNKKIITEYKLLKNYKDFSKIEIQIHTGKKHQIRVQMSEINHPILGDTKYNKISSLNFKNLCLQSNEIKFNFPNGSFLNYLNTKTFKLDHISFL